MHAAQSRKYVFNWSIIGNTIGQARPQLGDNTKVEIYRLFQFTLRDILEQHYGTEMADKLFFDAGVLAGKSFFEHYCHGITDINTLAKTIQDQFRELGVGIVRFEKADTTTLQFQLTVDEDLDCSGLPDTADHICVYDEGFIKGILDSFTGKNFSVQEIDCWCSGARTCRFRAVLEG